MQAVFWLPGNPPQPERRVWSIVIIRDQAHHVCTYMYGGPEGPCLLPISTFPITNFEFSH